jgi:DNA-binding MarR family transcriptional regulator
MGISDIIVEECDKFQVSATALRNGSRRSKVSEARAEIARRCAEELGLTAAEIARYLGVSTSAITKAIARV